MSYKRILVIPDIQAPYHHKDTIGFLTRVKKDVKPDFVTCAGDELDQYTLSKYPHDPDAPSGGYEYSMAMDLWKQIFALYPRGLSVTSNHVERVSKKAVNSGIPSAYLKKPREFMQAPSGWNWHERFIVDDVQWEHGERAGSGAHGLRTLVVANMRSTVIGHYHETPGTIWTSNGERVLWGLNAGSLVDTGSYGLSYSRKNRHKAVAGCGLIIEGNPRFQPYY